MSSRGWVATLVVVGLVVFGSVGVASAHETATVDGYELTFGGSDEPVVTGERMWLQVEVLDADTGEAVEGLDDSVAMAVQRPFGDDTHELDVDGVFGQPGLYEGAVVFTEPGTYTVFVTVDVDGTRLETSFQTQVHNASQLRYPPASPTTSSDAGLDAATGFGLGVVVSAVGMLAAFVVGRRTRGRA